MKRRMIVLLLVLCLTAALVPTVLAADEYNGQVNVEAIVQAGKSLFAAHEGVYDTVVPSDVGAVGMGIMGWRGPKALQLMKMICDADPELSYDTLGDALYTEIILAPADLASWNNREFNAEEAAAASALLGTEVGIACQEELARMDITTYIGYGWKAGVRSDAAILYYCSVENHYGHGGAGYFMSYIRETMGITANDTINTLAEFHAAVVEAAKTYNSVNQTLAYRTKIFKYIRDVLQWDIYGGSAPAVAPSHDCAGAQFTDMPAEDNWAHAGIDFVVERGLFNGTSTTTFSPDAGMTRAMLVTVLWRLDGKPEDDGETPFTDVPADAYYTQAVAWAEANGIVNGVDEDRFCPDGRVTREMIATILFRYAQYKGVAGSLESTELTGYADVDAVSEYARYAMIWTTQNAIIQGSNGCLHPGDCATRAQVAAILMRYVQNLEAE